MNRILKVENAGVQNSRPMEWYHQLLATSMAWIQNATGFSVDLLSEMPFLSHMPKRDSLKYQVFSSLVLYLQRMILLILFYEFPILYFWGQTPPVSFYMFVLGWKGSFMHVSMTTQIGRHINNISIVSVLTQMTAEMRIATCQFPLEC